jgi:hypothetical protein
MGAITGLEFEHAVVAGEVLDRPGDTVDAELIRSFCRRPRTEEVDPRGIRLRGLRVLGVLDLTGVEVPFGLRFEDCSFEAAPILHGARLRELGFVGCPELPGVLANGIAVQGDLELSGSTILGSHPTGASTSRSAAVWLCESGIGGRFRCLGTVIDAQGERAIHADRLHVAGTVRLLGGFHARGELRLVGAQISGSLDMAGANVESDGLALDLGDAAIAGNLFVEPTATGQRPRITGLVNLSSARVDGKVQIRDAALARPVSDEVRHFTPRFSGLALVGLGLAVGAELAIEGSTIITGGVDLSSASLGRFDLGAGAELDAPNKTALNLTNAEIRSDVTIGEGVRVRGTTVVIGANVRGRLRLDGAVLTDPVGKSLLKADGATIAGDVDLRRLRATGGQLKFWRTTIGGGFDAGGAVVENPQGATVRLHQSDVGGSVRLVDGFHSTGCVALSRTVVGGRLDLDEGRFVCPAPSPFNDEGAAIRAVSATFRGGMDLGRAWIEPAINLTGVGTTVLQDDPGNWPERIYIAGFTYDRFDAPSGGPQQRVWDWQRRLAWLRRQPEHDAGPYEQAARVFRQHGYTQSAEQLLMAQRVQARRAEGVKRSRASNVLDWFYGWTVGYGYRPGRVLWLLAALLVLVTVTLSTPGAQQSMRASDEGTVFTVDGPLYAQDPATVLDPCGGGRVRCFNPLLYAVDTVVPLIDLDQRATWYPDRFVAGGRAVEWWLNIATVVGWLLSSIFLLSFARLARNA